MLQKPLIEAYNACNICGEKVQHNGLGTFTGSNDILLISNTDIPPEHIGAHDWTPPVRCSRVDNEEYAVLSCSVYTTLLARNYTHIIIIGKSALTQLGLNGMEDFEKMKVNNKSYLYLEHVNTERFVHIKEAFKDINNEA